MIYITKWFNDLNTNERSKLRTYRLFKLEYCTENYLCTKMQGRYRSAFAKFRCGVAPIKIETGRYEGLSSDNRFCFNECCTQNQLIEDEKHVLLKCPLYSHMRQELFDRAISFNDGFLDLNDTINLYFCLQIKTYVFIQPKSAMIF